MDVLGIVLIWLCASFFGPLYSPGAVPCDDDVRDSIVQIEGRVSVRDPKTGMDVTSSSRQNLFFRRLDCGKCIYVAITNAEGDYHVLLSEGKYKLLVNNRMNDLVGDQIAPDQTTVVQVTKNVPRTRFDVKLISGASKNPAEYQWPD